MIKAMEQILIQNFKAIVNEEKRPINVKKMTVLMGEQGSGKSTVAKLIYFFKTLGEEITIPLTGSFPVTEENLKQIVESQIYNHFIKLFGPSRRMGNFEILYTYPNNDKIKIWQIEPGNIQINIDPWLPKLQRAIGLNRELNRLENEFGKFEQRDRNRVLNAIGQVIDLFLN